MHIGTLPANFNPLLGLTDFDVGSDVLHGKILHINNDRLLLYGFVQIGPIPSSFGTLTNLKGLHLADNSLTGMIIPDRYLISMYLIFEKFK